MTRHHEIEATTRNMKVFLLLFASLIQPNAKIINHSAAEQN